MIDIRGELGERLTALQNEAAASRGRLAEVERDFESAKREVPECDALVSRLQGEEQAGLRRVKELKSARNALEAARRRSSEDAFRGVAVARAEAEARAGKVRTFAQENQAELLADLYEQGVEIVGATTDYLRAAADLKQNYNTVYGSGMELLRLLGRNTAELPSADGALSFYRNLAQLAQTPPVSVPAIYSERRRVAA